MLEITGDLGFHHEPGLSLRVVGMFVPDALECHLAVQLAVERDVDFAQAAAVVETQNAKAGAIGPAVCGSSVESASTVSRGLLDAAVGTVAAGSRREPAVDSGPGAVSSTVSGRLGDRLPFWCGSRHGLKLCSRPVTYKSIGETALDCN